MKSNRFQYLVLAIAHGALAAAAAVLATDMVMAGLEAVNAIAYAWICRRCW